MIIVQLDSEQLTTLIQSSVRKVLSETNFQKNEQGEIWFDLPGLMDYDPEKRSKPTWYSKISKGEVPYHKKGKKVYFLKSEIDNWLKAGRKQTFADVKAEADVYLSNNKLGLKHGK